ncbi:hypothetical protein [Streptomyces sp. NRRL WC-3744]|uniref:hypothetical protein n=1 Tax=Streptomyces sp. NRRL WC-3744 TaxID=1463935 RepID=UPI0004C562BC|nr:hypothetical protein [Streptomyces sp. NRRL WC-3744]
MTAHDERDLVRQIEGHLLLAAAREEGRTAAVRLSSRLGWLTDSQRDDMQRQFEAEYLALARLSWHRTAERAQELRQAYESRYRALRRRLLACCVLGCAVLAAAVLLVVSAAA